MNLINFALLNLALSRISRVSGWVGENKIKDQLSQAEAEIGAELGNSFLWTRLPHSRRNFFDLYSGYQKGENYFQA